MVFNKKGKTSPLVIIALLVAAGLIVPGLTGNNSTPKGITEIPFISTGSTALTLSAVDAASQGTAVGVSSRISVNDAAYTSGVTTASPNDNLKILLINDTTYHNQFIESHVVPSAPTDVISAKLNKNASLTLTMFNNNNDVLTNGGGAVNQTVVSGGAYTDSIRIDGQDKASTQAMTCILESSDATKADKMTLSGLGATLVGQAKPNWYTLAGVNSGLWVYEVDAVAGAVSVNGNIQTTSKTGQSLAGTTGKIACYTQEFFLDSEDGQVKFGTEDANGNLQSMASYSYTWAFQ